jgi:phospho-N-acetylmuramoyl-pentapeptide-transferase
MQELVLINIEVLIRIFWLTAIAFVLGIVITPAFTNFLYKNNIGKKIRKTSTLDDQKAPVFYKYHKKKENTPTMGGLLIWVVVGILTILFNLDRAETYLPLFTLVAAGIIGAIDDLLNTRGIGPNRGGLSFKIKLIIYLLVAFAGAWWFYSKLGWSSIHIPGGNLFGLPYNVELGMWYIPFFILVVIGTSFSSNQTDGLDGLLGGIMALCFFAYSVIALTRGQAYLAIFCGTITGSILSFLWFNVHPARFFMGDTGSFALGMTLAVVAFLTNSVVVLPIIALVLVIEAISTILQIFSKKYLGKKIFLSAPIHHHFQGLGWSETKVVERFWIISAISAVIGLVIALIGRG